MLSKFQLSILGLLSVTALTACNINVSKTGDGIVTSDDGQINCGEVCTAAYEEESTVVTLTAIPDEGFLFDGFTGKCINMPTPEENWCEVSIGGSTGSKDIVANFIDINFAECVQDTLDEIGATSVSEIEVLNCDGLGITKVNLHAFTSLTHLYLSFNELTEIDVSQNTALEVLDLLENKLTKIDITQNMVLELIGLEYNELTEIDFSLNTVLRDLRLDYNQITEIDFSENTALTSLYLPGNALTEIDIPQNTALEYLNLRYNPFTQEAFKYLDTIDWINDLSYWFVD